MNKYVHIHWLNLFIHPLVNIFTDTHICTHERMACYNRHGTES